MCCVCVCVNTGFVASVGYGFTSQCFDIGVQDLAAAIGGRVPDAV